MQVNFEHHTKWIIASLILFIAIIILLPNSAYKSSKMGINRNEAIKTAKELLSEQGIDLKDYYVEGLLNNSPIESRYLVKKLGNNKFEKLIETDDIPSYGWTLYFHKNLSKEIAQIKYAVNLNYKGQITAFEREIPDTLSSPSFSTSAEAENYIKHYLTANSSIDVNDFRIVEKKSMQMSKRTDYLFTWEKVLPGYDSIKLQINALVQGNKLGSISSNFQIPQSESGYFATEEVFYSTISLIFIFFFTLVALYQFLKRYHQGEIWMNVGKNFFIIYFVISSISIINSWPGAGRSLTLGNMPFITTKFIVLSFEILILNLVLSLLLFASWSVGESLTRGLWPDKFRGIDAFIKGKIFTVTSGTSLLKGFTIGLATALIYLILPALINKESAFCFINPVSQIGVYSGYLPALDILTKALDTSILTGAAIVFFTTNLTYSKFRNTKLSILISGIVVTASAAISYTPPVN